MKFLRGTGIALLMVGVCVFAKPAWFVNESSWRFLLKRLESRGIHVTADHTHLSARPAGFAKVAVALHLTQPCIDIEPGLHGCFENLDLEVVIPLIGATEVRTCTAERGIFTQSKKASTAVNPFGWIHGLKRLESWKLGKVALSVDRFDLIGEHATSTHQIRVGNLKNTVGLDISHAWQDPAGRKLGVALAVHPQIPPANGEGLFSLRAVRYDVHAHYVFRKLDIEASAQGTTENTVDQTQAMFRVRGLSPRMKEISSKSCNATLKKDSDVFGFEAQCPARVQTTSGPALEAKVRAEFDLPLRPQQQTRGSLDLSFLPDLGQAVSGEIRLHLMTEGQVGKSFSTWTTESKLSTHLVVSDFQALVRQLKDTRYAVVAPFHVMQGTLRVDSDGDVDLNQGGSVPATIRADLTSPSQRLLAESQTQLKISYQRPFASVDADVILQDVRLELPKIDVELLPRFYLAKTIHEFNTPQDPRGPAFRFKFRLRTDSQKSGTLLSNLADGAIPTSIDITKAMNQPVTGSLTVGKFPLRLFRHPVDAEHFKLTFKFPVRDSDVEGIFVVRGPEYSIRAVLSGTLYRPVLQVNSTPAMTRTEMISTLLFSKRAQDLTEDQTQSVHNTSAALSDRAVEMGSVYALASSVIEGVEYDRETGAMNVRVQLADGAVLKLTTQSGGLGRVGVEKRLGNNWVLSSDVGESGDNKGASASAILEWINRY